MMKDISDLFRLVWRICIRLLSWYIRAVVVLAGLMMIVCLLPDCSAHADTGTGSGWFCDSESAKRDDDVFWACGMAEGISEGVVRADALKAAIQEFNMVCELSTDCRGRGRRVTPARTTCTEAKNGVVKCVRMIEVELFTK